MASAQTSGLRGATSPRRATRTTLAQRLTAEPPWRALTFERNPDFKSEQVLEKLLNKAATNYITDLKKGDTNKLLYIAAVAPPPPGSVAPAPEPQCPGWCTFCLVPACKGCCD